VSIKILLLEDDLLFGETLTDLLEDEGYEVFHYTNGQEVLDATYEQKFHLYILDINVPLLNGIDVLRALRDANDETPAIFLTSHKDSEMVKKGFGSGCDDYITKPFSNEELLLRIQARLRRGILEESLEVGSLVLDTKYKRVVCKGQELDLSKKEFELLMLLMQNANKAVPKEMMIEQLWSASESGSDGALRVYINRLKQILGEECSIENIRGIGYKLVS
jgi:DNA-binding response OmpR family regulator